MQSGAGRLNCPMRLARAINQPGAWFRLAGLKAVFFHLNHGSLTVAALQGGLIKPAISANAAKPAISQDRN